MPGASAAPVEGDVVSAVAALPPGFEPVTVALHGAPPPYDPGEATAQTVFPPDGRQPVSDTTVAPFRAIAHLVAFDNDQISSQCTGSFIGPSVVLTAAHCVTHKDRKTTPDRDAILVDAGQTAEFAFLFGTAFAARRAPDPFPSGLAGRMAPRGETPISRGDPSQRDALRVGALAVPHGGRAPRLLFRRERRRHRHRGIPGRQAPGLDVVISRLRFLRDGHPDRDPHGCLPGAERLPDLHPLNPAQ
ncbi:MAG: trypsin-like serine protease [Thermoflexaceae bacterium]|nr:trypsin-like serine protease [Thermoflexaceae bacterium]